MWILAHVDFNKIATDWDQWVMTNIARGAQGSSIMEVRSPLLP